MKMVHAGTFDGAGHTISNFHMTASTTVELAIGSYWPTKNNGLMKSATYQFDEDGIMAEPAV
jgi:hypothetical protein